LLARCVVSSILLSRVASISIPRTRGRDRDGPALLELPNLRTRGWHPLQTTRRARSRHLRAVYRPGLDSQGVIRGGAVLAQKSELGYVYEVAAISPHGGARRPHIARPGPARSRRLCGGGPAALDCRCRACPYPPHIDSQQIPPRSTATATVVATMRVTPERCHPRINSLICAASR
jgi:hypothetical protein